MAVNPGYDYYLSANLEKHAGKWVAIIKDEVVAEGIDIQSVLEEAKRKHPGEEPLLAKVPKKETLIL